MIRHMVLFRFKPGATDTERGAVLDGLARLPSHFPAMRRFGLGENISRRDATFPHPARVPHALWRRRTGQPAPAPLPMSGCGWSGHRVAAA